MVGSANYDPYGSPEGAALPAPFGYTGELTDPATGSQYLRARWYRPGQGTLLGVDPALDSTGQPYSYANDNPANGSDPSGRCRVHLAGTEYSYLGAEGAGPCSKNLSSTIGEIFRQGDGIPCLAVVGSQRYLVLNPGQTTAQISADVGLGGGGAATAGTTVGALAVVGGGLTAEAATLPVTGPLAGTGPPGWVIDAIIFVGVAVVAIGISLFIGTQVTSVPTDTAQKETGEIVYHYSSKEGVKAVYEEHEAIVTGLFRGPNFAYPPGFYGSILPPEGPITQPELSAHFFGGNRNRDMSWWVSFSTLLDPFIETYSPSSPDFRYYPGPPGGRVSVHPLAMGQNKMPV